MHGLFGLIVPLLASASLVLTDGQVIKGSEVTRQGDTYLVQGLLRDGARISARGISSATALARVPAVGDMAPFSFAAEDAVLVSDAAA